MKIDLSWSINVNGLWWDVRSEHSIPDALSSDDKMARIRSVISGLSRVKGVIPRTTKITNSNNGGNQTQPIDPGAGASSPTLLWPNPGCPVHEQDMAKSKIQEEAGHSMYYCPQKIASGYCKHRAKVSLETGVPKLWEVK